MKKSALVLSLLMVMGFTSIGNAASVGSNLEILGTDSLGRQLIYDADYDITWLDFTSPAMTWNNALVWASSQTVVFKGVLYDEWRLPTAKNPDGTGPGSGYNQTGSELGHLYYTELGNTALSGVLLTGPFSNLAPLYHWDAESYDATRAWYFSFNPTTVEGRQYYTPKTGSFVAMAVYDGRAGGSSVPLPGTILLLGSGIVGLVSFRKRRQDRV